MCFSFQFFLAQQNHTYHRHEQQHGDDFKRQRVLREQKFAEREGFAFERRFGGVWPDGRERFDKDADQGADGNQAGGEAEEFNLAALFFLQVEQHDDENEQHQHGARLNNDLHRREKERVQQHEQAGHRDDGQHQKHRAGDRAAAERICDDERAAQQRQCREDVKQNVRHHATTKQIVEGFHFQSSFHRETFLLFGFFQLEFPFLDAGADAAKREQFFLVVNHLFAAGAGERVVLLQKDRFLRANFLAEAAKDAAQHVDLKFLRHLFRVGAVGGFAKFAGRRDADGFRRANKFAKLARNAFRVAVLILHEIGRAAIFRRERPFLLGIFHRHHFALDERGIGVLQRDFQSADDGRQIKLFPKRQGFAIYNHFRSFQFHHFNKSGFGFFVEAK